MHGRYFLDTNIFLRIVVKDDKKKAEDCAKLLEMARAGKIHVVTSHLVLAEFVWTCLSLYRLKKLEVVKLVSGIASIPHLSVIDVYDTLRALALYEKYSVKFIDALIASHSFFQEHGCSIISYDTDFDILGLTRLEPAHLLSQ